MIGEANFLELGTQPHTNTTTSVYILCGRVISINARVRIAIFAVLFRLRGRS